MRAFLITLIIVVLAGLGMAWYLQRNAANYEGDSLLGKTSDYLTPDNPEPVLRTPVSYHLLEDQGGIPRAEAEASGLVTDQYAYLAATEPIQISDGVEPASALTVGGKPYDFCFKFNTTPPEQQYLEFNLLGQWDELHFGFGFDDKHPSDPKEQWAIEFRVETDGAVAFGPIELTPVDRPEFAKVETTGVNRVTFVTKRIGYRNPFAPVVVDPFVIKLPEEK